MGDGVWLVRPKIVAMYSIQTLRVYNAAEWFAVDVARVVKVRKLRPNDSSQLLRSSGAISDLIAEGYGRGAGADRKRVYRQARGEVLESMNQLKKLLRRGLLSERVFYPLFNRGLAIVNMLDRLID